MWVAGVRDTRSKRVRIKDWAMPAFAGSPAEALAKEGGAR